MEKLRLFLKTEKEKMSKLNRKQKAEYIWDYYKIHIIATVFILTLTIYTIVSCAGRGQTSLYVVLINSAEGDNTLFSQIMEENGYTDGTVSVDTTMTYHSASEMAEGDIVTIQVLAALFGMGDMDLFAANPEVFDRYTGQNAFENLGLLLPQELQRQHEDQLVRYTTEGGQDVVGGILFREGSPLHQAGFYQGDVVIGIATQAEHLDEALAVIRALLEMEP